MIEDLHKWNLVYCLEDKIYMNDVRFDMARYNFFNYFVSCLYFLPYVIAWSFFIRYDVVLVVLLVCRVCCLLYYCGYIISWGKEINLFFKYVISFLTAFFDGDLIVCLCSDKLKTTVVTHLIQSSLWISPFSLGIN